MLTNNKKKIGQMSQEWSTALSLVVNVGPLVGKENFPPGSKCIICADNMYQAEHLVDKARGGNHTHHNVIAVCRKHTKGNGHFPADKPHKWKSAYTPEQIEIIEQHTGTNHEARLNPFRHAINEVKPRKEILQKIIEDFMEETVGEIHAIHCAIDK